MTKEEILKSNDDNGPKVYSHYQATKSMSDYVDRLQEYATQEKQGWVKTTTPPDHERKVLVVNRFGAYFIMWFSEMSNQWIMDGEAVTKKGIQYQPTHYMELPQKPEV